MSVETSFVEKLQRPFKRSYRSWKRSKRDWENNINLQTFCLCNLGLKKEVRLFLIQFIILLLLINLLSYPSLKELLNNQKKNKRDYKETLKRCP
jgi:hypothetical protein